MKTITPQTANPGRQPVRIRIPLARKIVLLVALFVIPLVGVTIYFLLKGPNKDIAFAQQEKKGNEYLRPLERLLIAIPKCQTATGNAKAVAEAKAEIASALAALNDVQGRVGAELDFTVDGLSKVKRSAADPAAIRSIWESIEKGNIAQAETDAKFAQLLSAVSDAIVHAGDKSNLILDPDLDTYYLMDATLNTLPQISRRLAAAALYLRDHAIADQDTRQQLAIFASQLGDDISAIRAKFETSYNEDTNFYGRSESLRANTEVALNDAGRAVDRVIASLTSTSEAEKLSGSVHETRAILSQLWGKAVDELDVLLQRRIDSLANTRLSGLIITAGLLVAASLAAALILRTITRPVAALSAAVERVAAGDESARAEVGSQDEVGRLAVAFNSMVAERASARQRLEQENKRLQGNIQELLIVVADASDGNLAVRARVSEGALGNVADALNLMFENVGDLIKSAKEVSSKVQSAANVINTAAADLTTGSTQQSTQLERASTDVRHLSAEAKAVSDVCGEATRAAEQAQQAAERGQSVVREVISGMDAIRESVQVNGRKIKRLGERSMEIGGILKTINEISAQTDMLALNASIEAGRAGEAGRGFSAVAEQVRALAERAKVATQQIEKLVGDIQAETTEVVGTVEGQTVQVENGALKVAQAGEALNDIVQVSNRSRDFVQRISGTAQQQAAKTVATLEAVSAAASIANESRSRVTDARLTSDELSKLSSVLSAQLDQFQLNGAN